MTVQHRAQIPVATIESGPVVAHTMATPIGPLTIVAMAGVVHAGGFTEDVAALTARLEPSLRAVRECSARDLAAITRQLDAYFAGDLLALDEIPVSMHGGPFQQRVWRSLRAIRPGQRTTYRDLAVELGGEKLARAVGMGCATNLISPIIPCHRVTRTSGNLAGYYWSLDRKRWLLDHERRHAPTAPAPPLPRQGDDVGEADSRAAQRAGG